MSLTKYNLTDGHTSSTWFTFSRSIATLDPQGNRVAVNVPRWNFQRSIAGLWGDEETINGLSSLYGAAEILAAGYDETSGASPNPLLFSQDGSTFYFHKWNASTSSFDYQFRTFYGRYAVTGGEVKGPDIRSLRTPIGDTMGSDAFVPIAAMIVYGTLLVVCQKWEWDSATAKWIATGTAFAYHKTEVFTHSSGPEFEIYFDDTVDALPVNPFKKRVNFWSACGVYSPFHLGTVSQRPSEVVATVTDYQYAPAHYDSHPPPDDRALPQDPRIYWFKLKPDTSGRFLPLTHSVSGVDHPSVAVLTIASTAFFTDPANTDSTLCSYVHAHAAGVLLHPSQEAGFQIIIATGDVGASMVRVLVNNGGDTAYYLPANWTVILDWHGQIDSALHAGTATALANDGNAGNQFVGVGPGPTADSLLVGGDGRGEGSWILIPGASGDTPTHKTVIGSAGVNMHGPANFVVHTDRPDVVPRTVIMDDTRSTLVSVGFTGTARSPLDDLAFSRDSGTQGSFGFVPRTGYRQNCFVLGNYVYLSLDVNSGTAGRIVRRQLPPLVSGKPLQVGPGGRQWLVNNPLMMYVNSRAHVIPCGFNTTTQKWEEMSIGSVAGAALDPQPPGNVAAVYRVTQYHDTSTSSSSDIVTLFPTRSGSGSEVLPAGTDLGLGFRFWMRSNSARQADSPQRNSPANRSCSVASIWTEFIGGTAAENIKILSSFTTMGDMSGWQCFSRAFTAKRSSSSDAVILIRTSDGLDTDTDFYIALSELCEFKDEDSYAGVHCFGYPLLPRSLPAAASVFPPELVAVEHMFADSFTLFFAGLTPEDSWDQYGKYGAYAPILPLISITSPDEARYLCIRAIPGGDDGTGFVASYNIKADSASTSVASPPFLRGRGLIGAITYDVEEDHVIVYLCHDGRYLNPTKISSMGWAAHKLGRIKFGDQRASNLCEVGAFQWMGVAADSTAYTEEDVIAMFKSLDFL